MRIFPNNQRPQINPYLGAFTAFAVVNILYNLYQKIVPMPSLPMAKLIDINFEKFGELKEDIQSEDNSTIKELIYKINQCPSTKQLWGQVNKEKPINLILDSDITPYELFHFSPENRTMAIPRTTRFDLQFLSLLFGLCDIKHPPTDLIKSTKLGQVSQKEYLDKTISETYENLKCIHEITSPCEKSRDLDWGLGLNFFKGFEGENAIFRTAESAYQYFILDPDPGQKNFRTETIQNWNDLGKIPYCANNPQAPECAYSEL